MKKISLLFLLMVLAACQSGPGADATAQPDVPDAQTGQTPETPAVTLTVCLALEPSSLNVYDAGAAAAAPIFQALYGGTLGPDGSVFQAGVLEKAPSLADGDAVIQEVSVAPGEAIVDADGNLAVLEPGTSYHPAGCRDGECAQVFRGGDGENVVMDQMVVSFRMRAGLNWSDAEELDAGDSVYGFEMAGENPESPYGQLAARTQDYIAVNASEIEWRGLPGYLDRNYTAAFFPPLPAHLIEEQTVIGYGPYRVAEWISGDRLVMSPNPYYGGQVYFNRVEFAFIGPDPNHAVGQLLSGGCDLLAGDFDLSSQMETLLAAEGRGEVGLAYTPGSTWEHLDLGIQPISYDEFYNVAQGDRPDFFGDGRVRQAMAMCIDRQKLIDEFAYGQGEVMHSFVPPSHPDHDPQARQYVYDPAAGIALLEQAGWVLDEEGRRVSQGVFGIPDGLEIILNYHTTDSEFHTTLAQSLAQDLNACGIKVNVVRETAEALFAPGPDGVLFGRSFDLAQFAWPLEVQPSCYLYYSDAVPGGDYETFPYLWGGWNLTGWQNQDYDQACRLAQQALPGEGAYLENHHLAQQIFSGELPVIPLFAPARVYAARADLCGWEPLAGGDVLWNLETFLLAEVCN